VKSLTARAEIFPIRGSFRISREERTEAKVVVAEISDGTHTGRGECVPYPRYRESVDGVLEAIRAMAEEIENGLTSEALQSVMAPGAARCAVDCALLDYEAKATGISVAERFGIDLKPLTTLYTISLGEPEAMAEAATAAAEAGHRRLKVKLGQPAADEARIKAVRAAVPDATLVVDANEGWSDATLLRLMSACAEVGVELIEQPLPATRDGVLATISHPVPVCADESAHVTEGLLKLKPRYDAVNVKLNKTGGLTEALKMVRAAKAADFKVMVGCMLGTSLAMAPAVYAAQNVDFVDLDAPLLLSRDRNTGLTYEGSTVSPPEPALWG